MAKKKSDDTPTEPPTVSTPARENIVWSFSADEWRLIEEALITSRSFAARALEEQQALMQKVREARQKAQ